MARYLEKFFIFQSTDGAILKRIQVNPKWFQYPLTTVVDVFINGEVVNSIALFQLLDDIKISAKSGVAQFKVFKAITLPKNAKLEFGFRSPNAFGVSSSGPVSNAPIVTAFEVPIAHNSLDVPISTFTAVSTLGLISYKITEVLTPPSPADPTWTVEPPTTFICGGSGVRTLYAWAKDPFGNVSAPLSASIMIDMVAPSAPVITNPYSGYYTTHPTITVSGTSEAFCIIHVLVNGVEAALPVADMLGSWSVIGISLPTVASYVLTAIAEDTAGNLSELSASVPIERRYPPLEAPLITSPTNNTLFDAETIAISISSAQAVAGRVVRFWKSSTSSFSGAIEIGQAVTLADGTATNSAVPL